MNFFNGTDKTIYDGTKIFQTKISASPTTYGLSAAMATAYASVSTSYCTSYDVVANPDLRTRVAVAEKNAARAALKAMANDLAKIIQGTPSVTDAMKIELGLNVRKPPAPVPVPDTQPVLDVESVSGRVVKIRVYAAGGDSKRRKATGASSASIYSYVGPTAPDDPAEYTFQGLTTRTTATLEFPQSVPTGATIWLSAAWLNPRAIAGPGSNPTSFTLQGGAAVPQAG